MPFPPNYTELNWKIRNPHIKGKKMPKPISPAQAKEAYDKRITPELDRLVNRINETATNSGSGTSFTFRPQGNESRVMPLAIKLFKAEGWTVKQESDQREGDSWYVFSAVKYVNPNDKTHNYEYSGDGPTYRG